ncbi:MAG: hypothetical protein JWN34_6318 [Bryobacterales bacterium]|nr:hypothetical protein [Bryobacterales bacterium]
MFITRKHLSRRVLLRGVGAAIALPFLDAMIPAFGAPATSEGGNAALRLAFVYIPNGAVMADWTPTAAGTDFNFTSILKPLEKYREDVFVLTGLAANNGNALGDGGGDHARAAASFLTGVHPKKTSGADIRSGISADQLVAKSLDGKTRLSSLELGCDDTRLVGSCDTGYSCAYTNTIVWRGPNSPLPPETNPRLVFERLFGSEDFSVDPAVRVRRAGYRKSILDMARERTATLMNTIGPADKRKVDEYLYAIRETEKRIETAERDNRNITPQIEKPSGVPIIYGDYMKLMYDLKVLAFQADITRVATTMVAREGSVRVYPEIGVPDPHHPLSHHRNDPETLARLSKINQHHMDLFAYFIGRLKATQDGDGTLLDHSMVVYGGGLSDSNRHLHENLPVVVAGRGNGKLKPGRHVIYEKQVPVTNLYMTLMGHMGVRPESIGDSNGQAAFLSDT